jgi:nucleoside diphosphate kinase
VDPRSLTTDPEKGRLYGVDVYFREGWEDLLRALGELAPDFCRRQATVLCKPDAVVAHKLLATLRWLEDQGYELVEARRLRLDRHGIRALWQYGWNSASRDRRDAADLYMTTTDCLLVLVARSRRPWPATVVLSTAKGPARPQQCRPGQLRRDLGSHNYQLNFVHTPDEPADMIRELAVLGDVEQRTASYEAARAGRRQRAEVYALAAAMEAEHPVQHLGFAAVLSAVESAAAAAAASPPLRTLFAAIRDGRSRDWRELLRLLDDSGVEVTRWQRIVLATQLLNPDRPGAGPLLRDMSAG